MRAKSMRAYRRIALGLGSVIAAASGLGCAHAATITGTVAGPDGKAFRGAFVQARNLKTKITVSVLSDNAGKYRIENLPAGDYRLAMRAIGFKADPKSGITLAADQNLAQDLSLQQGMVRWSDISMHQGKKLLPEGRGKEELFTHCMACHGFESRMAAVVRDEDGWRDRVNYMKDAMGYFIMDRRFGFNEQKSENVVSYINAMFGENSKLPKSPADLPQYQSEVRPFSDEALKIVYVEYDTPGARPDAVERAPRQGRHVLGAVLRPRQQDREPQSGHRRDEGIPGPQHGHRRDPLCGPASRRQRVAHRAGLRQARPLGSEDQGDHRISGHRRQAHRAHRSQDRDGVVDRGAVGVRSQDREVHPHPGSADQLRHRARPGGQCLVHRAHGRAARSARSTPRP